MHDSKPSQNGFLRFMSQGCDRWMNTTVLHRIPTRLACAAASWTSIAAALVMIAMTSPVLGLRINPMSLSCLPTISIVQDIGCYHGPVETPVLDGLAKRGTRFETFYSGCAVCSPSRATLLTGRHHIRTGVYSWISDENQHSHLLLRERTIAEVFDQGYATAHIGKWHLGLPTPKEEKPTPDEHGFDTGSQLGTTEPSHENPRNFISEWHPVGPLKGYSPISC